MSVMAKEGTEYGPRKYIDVSMTDRGDFFGFVRYHGQLICSAIDGIGTESEWAKQLVNGMKGE